MTRQRLHPSLAEIDVVTPDDMYRTMGHSFSDHLRDRWRTIKLMKLPQQRGTATSGTLILAQGSGYANDAGTPVGPEQGFVWMLRRVIVTSNAPGDAAKYTLYSGSDPTLIDSGHLLEGFTTSATAQATTLYEGGTGVGPGANATIVTTGVLSAGTYVVTPSAMYTGTTTFADAMNIALKVGATVIGTIPSAGQSEFIFPVVPVTVTIPPGGATISLATIGAGSGTQSALGQLNIQQIGGAISQGAYVGTGYYPGTDATWLFSGEQIYAQINGATAGNQYVMSGIAVEVASERIGALVG